MNKQTTLNVRVGGSLSDFVAANVGDNGAYENVSEYVRDLIRRDKERVEAEQFRRLSPTMPLSTQTPFSPARANADRGGISGFRCRQPTARRDLFLHAQGVGRRASRSLYPRTL